MRCQRRAVQTPAIALPGSGASAAGDEKFRDLNDTLLRTVLPYRSALKRVLAAPRRVANHAYVRR